MPVPPSIIIGIHGLANKPPAAEKPGYWKRALIEGLKRSCGKTTNDLSFDFVYWADLRYPGPISFSENPEYYYEDPGKGPFLPITPKNGQKSSTRRPKLSERK
jgi:hypothetical protein